MTQEIKDNDFEELIKSDKPVLIDFWAEWCGPCKMLTPILDDLSNDLGDKIKIVKMNIDENTETPSQLGVRSIPSLMIFKNGKKVANKVGAHSKNILEEWIKSYI